MQCSSEARRGCVPIVSPHAVSAVALAVLALSLVAAPARAARFQPASESDGRVALADVVEQPRNVRWANGDASVNCQVLVTSRGKADAAKCGISESGSGTAESVLGATYTGIRRAKFAPARVDGEAVDVVMSVRVDIRCIGDRCSVSTAPNLGLYAREYGAGYVAPQEILDDRQTWYERVIASPVCADGGDTLEACVDEGAFRLVVYADVDDAGHAANVRSRRNPLTAKAADIMDEVERAVQAARFIPAMHDGEPVPATMLSSSLHYENNRRIPRSVCVENDELGSRLAKKRCYNPQQHARVQPGLQIYSWLPVTTGDAE